MSSHSPLAQFEIRPLVDFPAIGGMDVDFTNSSLFMVIAVACVMIFFVMGLRRKAMVPGTWQNLSEVTYEFVYNMVRDNLGEQGKRFFPLILSLFLFVLFCNLLGLLPYSFTVTSHIAVTFALAAVVFIVMTIAGFAAQGTHFLAHFLPKGTPWWMAPLMYFIEFFSFLTRPVSLSIRLAANMLAGHTMLKVIAGFILMMGIGGILPFAFVVILVGFELFVAVLQAYIFTVLTCVYLNDVLHSH